MGVGHKLALHGMGKAPSVAWDCLPLAIGRVAHGKNVLCAGRIVYGIAFSSPGAHHEMAQRHLVSLLGRREIGTHDAANFSFSWIMGSRSEEPEILSLFRDVKLPAEPGNRVTFAQQKSVSDFRVCVRGSSSVHQAQNSSSAAVRNFKQDGVISLVHVLGFVEIQVCGKLDFPLGVAWSFIEIHDLAVVSVFWVDSKVDAADDPLVGACQSEGASVLNLGPRNDLHAGDMCVSGRSKKRGEGQDPSQAQAHGAHKPPPEAPQLTTYRGVRLACGGLFLSAVCVRPTYPGPFCWTAGAAARRAALLSLLRSPTSSSTPTAPSIASSLLNRAATLASSPAMSRAHSLTGQSHVGLSSILPLIYSPLRPSPVAYFASAVEWIVFGSRRNRHGHRRTDSPRFRVHQRAVHRFLKTGKPLAHGRGAEKGEIRVWLRIPHVAQRAEGDHQRKAHLHKSFAAVGSHWRISKRHEGDGKAGGRGRSQIL